MIQEDDHEVWVEVLIYRLCQLCMQVLNHRAVELVEEDQYVQGGEARATQSWGLDRIDQVSSHYDSRFNNPCNLTGHGVDVYVLDTGISRHVDLRGRVHTLNCGGFQQQHNNSCYGHGTHIAGTIGGRALGVAPGVNIFSVRVLNCTIQSTWNIILQGIECVLNHTKQRGNRPAVVNTAFYGSKHRAVKKAIDSLIKQGITVVGIAGRIGHLNISVVLDTFKYNIHCNYNN